MKLNITKQVKPKTYTNFVRFVEEDQKKIIALAKQYNTSKSEIIRALVNLSLTK